MKNIETVKTKKGFIPVNSIVQFAVGIGVVAIVASILASVVASQQATQTANSAAYNISGYGLTSMLNFGANLGTVGTVGGLAVIMIVLFAGLYMFLGGAKGR